MNSQKRSKDKLLFFKERKVCALTLQKKNLKKIGISIIGWFVIHFTITPLVVSVLPSFNAPAPSCIMVFNQTSNSIVIRNGCQSQQKVKIRVVGLAFGIGGNTGSNSCTTLAPGAIHWTRWWLGKFDRLETCFGLWTKKWLA